MTGVQTCALPISMEADPSAAGSINYYRPTAPLAEPVGINKPATPAEANKRKAGLDSIFGNKKP